MDYIYKLPTHRNGAIAVSFTRQSTEMGTFIISAFQNNKRNLKTFLELSVLANTMEALGRTIKSSQRSKLKTQDHANQTHLKLEVLFQFSFQFLFSL